MKKLILMLCAPALLATAACETALPTNVVTSPAPLANTTIDDTALDTAWRSFDLALDAIDLIPESMLKPGTPRAKAVASAIRKVSAALTAAEHFAAAGSTQSYLQAMSEAKAGVSELRTILKGQ